MAKRVCSRPGCPTLVDPRAYRGLCDTHRQQRDRERGTPDDRGYDAEHRAERKGIADLIRAGATVRCVTCGCVLGLDFHLGHNRERTAHIGPQCPPCNLSDAGRASHP